jgi:hypothetical protein
MANGVTPDIAGAVEGIRGWTTIEEARALYEAVIVASRRLGAPTVVEIGSYEGRSTVALGLAVRAAGAGRVYAIDPHGKELDHFAEFLENIDRAGLTDVVEPLRMTSEEARWRFDDRSVHVLFVDGSHDYDVVSRDLFDWIPALAVGAMAAFNDPFWPGVNRALRERVVFIGSPFRRPRFVSNSLFYDHDPAAPWTPKDSADVRRVRALMAAGRVLRGPHRTPEEERRAPQWFRHAQGTATDRLLNALVPPAREPDAPRVSDALLTAQALIQGAIRGQLDRTATFTSPRFRVRVRADGLEESATGRDALELFRRVASSVFDHPPEEVAWTGSAQGNRVDLSFGHRSSHGERRATVRLRLEGPRVASLDIETDGPIG